MTPEVESSLAFAADVLIEIAGHDEAFRYPMSSAFTIEGNLMDAMPGEILLGDETKDGEVNEYGADKKLMFKTSNGKIFFVFVRGQEVWLDLSRLERGDQGSAMYHAMANYAHNSRKAFIGDPAGLSTDAIVRRTTAMLSSALRTGTTAHFKPAAIREKLAAHSERVRAVLVEEYSSSPLWQARAAKDPNYWKDFSVGRYNL